MSKEKSNLQKSISNVKFGILNQFITIALGIILPRLVLVSLGSEANGLLNSINQAIVYLALLEGGIGLTITKALYGPVAQNNQEEINGIMSAANCFYRNVGKLYLIGVLVIAVVYPFVIKSSISKVTIFIVILLTGLPQVINFFFQGKLRTLLQVDGRGYILTNLSTVVFIGTSISKIILLLNGFGIIALQTMYLIFNLIQMIFITYYVKKNYSWMNLKVEPMTNKIGKRKSVFLHQISGFIFSNTDMLLISFFCNLKIVSVYAIYSMFFSMVSTLISNFTSSFVFVMGQKFQVDREKFLKWNRIFETGNMILVFALNFVLYNCILPFLKLYTEGISDVSYIDKILPVLFMVIQIIQSGRFASQKIIEYAGEFEETQPHAVAEMLINIIVSVIGVKILGIYGVLLGTICALIVRSILMIYYSNCKILHISQKRSYIKWFSNMITLMILCKVSSVYYIKLDTYMSIVIYAVILTVIALAIFSIVGICVDKSIFRFIKDEMKGKRDEKNTN